MQTFAIPWDYYKESFPGLSIDIVGHFLPSFLFIFTIFVEFIQKTFAASGLLPLYVFVNRAVLRSVPPEIPQTNEPSGGARRPPGREENLS